MDKGCAIQNPKRTLVVNDKTVKEHNKIDKKLYILFIKGYFPPQKSTFGIMEGCLLTIDSENAFDTQH